jgi:thermolysin
MTKPPTIRSSLVTALVLLSAGPLVHSQSPNLLRDRGSTFAIRASGFALAAELARIDDMLSAGHLDIQSTQEDTMIPGRVVERLRQVYEGIPVFGGQVVRQMDGRSIVSLSGRLYDNVDVDVTPRISSAAAGLAATASAGAAAVLRREPELCVLPVRGDYALAYRTQVGTEWDVRDVVIDAVTGGVISARSVFRSVNAINLGTGVFGDQQKMSVNSSGRLFQAIDGLRPATIVTLDLGGSVSRLNSFLNTGVLFNSDIATSGSDRWMDGPTVDAHAYQGMVYDYYFKRYGRHGLDDHDIEMNAIVHPLDRSQATRQPAHIVGTFINNAFFCCDRLTVFGDGDGRLFTHLAGALEIVGHEMSHGVTQYGADLIYEDESGALNEAFSDIMAVAIQYFYRPSAANWLLAEEVTLAPPGYVRSFSNPNAVGDPDHYSLRRFLGTGIDNGGVHFNVTIIDHAFYLAVVGGRNRVSGMMVAGIGQNNLERMERIFYRGFVYLLTANAIFSDARAATLQAAADLYGGESNERAQLAAAWSAVGVN